MNTKKVKRILIPLITILVLFITSLTFAQNEKDVYVIPIKGEINKSTYQFIKNSVENIQKDTVSAIIFDIDTYGGLIDEANKIKDLIINIDIPTISFVNNKAESAGVLIAISSEKIVMSKGATIGSAETIPNTEKIMSMWISQLRATANLRNRDDNIVAAMADKEIVIEGLVKKGELLNLNYKEAKDIEFIDLVSNNYEEILSSFNIDHDEINIITKSFKVKAAQFLVSPFIATTLLTLGFIGLVVEVLTPGFAAGGTISLISFALFFGGNFLAGNSDWTSIIMFIVGIILIITEVIIPGFGFPGIGGILSIVISIVLASGSPQVAFLSLSVAIVLTIVTIILLVKYGAKSPYLDKVILSTKQRSESGYTSTSKKEDYLGKEGVAMTILRPAGTINLSGDRIDAVSEGTYIKKGDKVKVIEVKGTRVVVKKI